MKRMMLKQFKEQWFPVCLSAWLTPFTLNIITWAVGYTKTLTRAALKRKGKHTALQKSHSDPGKVKLRYIFAEKKIATTVKHKAVSALLGAI